MGAYDRLKAYLGFGASSVLAERTVGLREPRLIVGQLPINLQLSRIGGSLTPQTVSEIIRQADTGYMWRLVDLANEARQKDGHLHSVLQTREIALTGLEWECRPPGRKTTAADKKAADFCTDAIKGAIVPQVGGGAEVCGFLDAVAHLSSAAYYGYSVTETLLAKDGRYIVPTAWSRVSPRRFVFAQQTGRLQWWDVAGPDPSPYPGLDLMTEFPGKFLQHQPRINGDVPCREGLVRVLMWPALFRNWTQRDWLQLAEMAWKPWRTGMYKKDLASKEDIENLVSALDNMTSTGVATFPDSTEVKVEWPKQSTRGNSAHGELCAFLGSEMSKAVLGQTLTTEQGQTGSQALGRVHDEVRKDIRDNDAKAVASTLRRHLLAPLVRLNFGDSVQVPEFCFLTEDAPDMLMFSQAVTTLAPMMQIPASWVRDRMGIPEPEGAEECLEAPEPPAPIAPGGDPNDPSADEPGAEKPPADAKPAAKPADKKPAKK